MQEFVARPNLPELASNHEFRAASLTPSLELSFEPLAPQNLPEVRALIQGNFPDRAIAESQVEELILMLGRPSVPPPSKDKQGILLRVRNNLAGYSDIAFNTPSSRFAELTCLVVDSSYRRHGYGKLLLKEMEKLATTRGVVKISLFTGLTGAFEAARRLYRSSNYHADIFSRFNITPCDSFPTGQVRFRKCL